MMKRKDQKEYHRARVVDRFFYFDTFVNIY